MSDLAKLVNPLERAAPSVKRALDGEAPDLAVKALAESTGTGVEPTPQAVHTALMGLPIFGILEVLGKAEKVLSTVLAPPEPASPGGSDTHAKPPAGPLDQALGGEKLAGWKTIIGIAAYAVVNVAAVLGVVPAVLTPEVVSALNTLIAGFIGVGLVAKLERYLAWLRPAGRG